MARLVLYARVSSRKQRDNTSIPDQFRRMEAFLVGIGHEAAVKISETGSSRDVAGRKEFQKALNAIFAGKYDGMCVFALDRFVCSVKHSAILEERFRENNKVLVSVLDLIDTSTPEGRLVYNMKAAVNQYRREDINAKCKRGMEARQRAGGYVSGRPAWGHSAKEKKLVFDTASAAAKNLERIVRERYVEGRKLREIAAGLNADNIPTPSGKGKWDDNKVFHISTMDSSQLKEQYPHLADLVKSKRRSPMQPKERLDLEKRILSWRWIDGMLPGEIAERLNKDGVKPSRAKRWTPDGVAQIARLRGLALKKRHPEFAAYASGQQAPDNVVSLEKRHG